MEGLNVALEAARDQRIFKGIDIPYGGPTISHLFYVDDALFIAKWSQSNLKNLARIRQCFHVTYGLKVNYHKSKVFGIGVSELESTNWANILGCEPGTLPFNYLGVPVGANMNLAKNWRPVIEKFQSKLSMWKSKMLSFSGRLTLIKSVLGNLLTYFMSLFKTPTGVVETLEKVRRRFLWGGKEDKRKIHWVAWEKVIAPKESGGLGVGSIKALNLGLIVKWWWRLKADRPRLWS